MPRKVRDRFFSRQNCLLLIEFMKYVGALIMIVVFLIGTGLLFSAGRQLILLIERAPYLVRTKGEIIEIRFEQRERRSRNRTRKLGEYSVGFPIVSFQTETGETIVFESQTGAETSEFERSGFRIGNEIAVIYDRENKLPPMINSTSNHAAIAVSAFFGLIMIGVSVLFFKFYWLDNFGFRLSENQKIA
jgi:hypothetical protein